MATLLGLMPPWDEEHYETRLQLANLMARQAEQGCLEEAWELFAETARAFPYTAIGIKALHGSCVLGLRLQLEPQKMDALLTVYPNRDAALLEVVRNSPRAEAQAILGTYGGTRTEELLNKYEKYRSSTKP
jgi:hypothetical protein